ncbi:MAG: winged helix-turn-helix transcriptional regulator [Alloprevotella sp.]
MESQKSLALSETMFPDCPVRNILSRLCDKWSLLLLHELNVRERPMRFSELRKAVPDISPKVLTATLRNLEADGFLVRSVYAEVPPRTDYFLTPRAHSFLEVCRPLVQWATQNFAAIMNDRKRQGE